MAIRHEHSYLLFSSGVKRCEVLLTVYSCLPWRHNLSQYRFSTSKASHLWQPRQCSDRYIVPSRSSHLPKSQSMKLYPLADHMRAFRETLGAALLSFRRHLVSNPNQTTPTTSGLTLTYVNISTQNAHRHPHTPVRGLKLQHFSINISHHQA